MPRTNRKPIERDVDETRSSDSDSNSEEEHFKSRETRKVLRKNFKSQTSDSSSSSSEGESPKPKKRKIQKHLSSSESEDESNEQKSSHLGKGNRHSSESDYEPEVESPQKHSKLAEASEDNSDESGVTNPTKAISTVETKNMEQENSYEQEVINHLKKLLRSRMEKDMPSEAVRTVKNFLLSFEPPLTQYYREVRFQKLREIKAEEKKKFKEIRQEKIKVMKMRQKELLKISQVENQVKSDVEFFSDPFILLYMLSFFELHALFMMRQTCRYIRQYIQNNFEKIPLKLLITSTEVTVEEHMLQSLQFSIYEKNNYKKLCVLAQEKSIIEPIAASSVQLAENDMNKQFQKLFRKTIERISPFIWLKLDLFDVSSKKSWKNDILSSKLHSNIILSNRHNSWLLPVLPNAKRVIYLLNFDETQLSLKEKITALNNIQLHHSLILEVCFLQRDEKKETNEMVGLNENIILYVFKPKITWILHKNHSIHLRRNETATFTIVKFENFYDVGRNSNHLRNLPCDKIKDYKYLFIPESYEPIVSEEHREYANRMFEIGNVL